MNKYLSYLPLTLMVALSACSSSNELKGTRGLETGVVVNMSASPSNTHNPVLVRTDAGNLVLQLMPTQDVRLGDRVFVKKAALKLGDQA